MREEFEALGLPPFADRGAVTDEYLRAFKELWTSENPTFEGQYCRFADIDFLPKPVQQPHPPDLGRWRKPARPAAYGVTGQWLVSYRRESSIPYGHAGPTRGRH
jgi:hypothetical protein